MPGLQHANSTKCIHCLRAGAGIHCQKCNLSFHFICGLNNGAAYVFVGSMLSFCQNHLPVQKKTKIRIEDRTCLAGCQELIADNERWVEVHSLTSSALFWAKSGSIRCTTVVHEKINQFALKITELLSTFCLSNDLKSK